ncbi:MAG: tRNA (adenosine(37)-N6)-dimethylallyltransferase MiaA, partial [Clostridia bacterium]|nr:tRNA (adenosine(37)-N6)-dimethylallyltransferase MiaA [Clostridia bacterium]
MNGKVIVVGGPTASGKSDLAVRLAKKYGGEVISADALLVYKGLNIGTAKPTKEEMQDIPHHLIDVVEPTQNFSVSDYERLALPILEDILSRGKTAIICGGTGF